MKPASGTMISNLENYSNFWTADLLTITLLDGTILRYTDFESNIALSGNVYSAAGPFPIVSGFQQKIGTEVDECKIQLWALLTNVVESVAVLEDIGQGLFDGADVVVQRVMMPNPNDGSIARPLKFDVSAGAVIVMHGNISDIVELDRTHAEFDVKSRKELLNIPFPYQTFQPSCRWPLYGAGCTLNQSSFTVAGSLAGNVLASDSFGRADANPIGANWSTISGVPALQIVSNQIEDTTTGGSVTAREIYSAISWPNDQYSQCTLVHLNSGSTSYGGVCVRQSTGADTGYYSIAGSAGDPNVYIARQLAGVHTNLASAAYTFSPGDVLYFSAVGTTLTVKINGVTKVTFTDTNIASGSAGLAVYAGSSVGDSIVDNWSGGSFASVNPLLFNTTLTNPSDYFDQGTITFTSGANSGITRTVRLYENASGQVLLWLALPNAPSAGDAFNIAPGCDKTLSTCTNKFGNSINYGAFPFIPPAESAI